MEKWLRRLIDQKLYVDFGPDYLNYQDKHENFYVNKKVRESVHRRRSTEPERYPRDIDAVLLDEAISIILNPNMYDIYFKDSLIQVFPIGDNVGRVLLYRIIDIRNHLAHANHISIRQAEQVLCYCHDVIDSLKAYYERKGAEKLYNVPTVIQVSDSLGNISYDSQINNNRNSTGGALIDQRIHGKGSLRSGDTLTIEVEVDPSFSDEDYIIEWTVTSRSPTSVNNGKLLTIHIGNEHVREDMAIYCTVTSNKDWHRLGDCDERLSIVYQVLPPI